MTKEKTSFVYVTYIRSTTEKVFEAIIKPEIARRYWGHENVSDWKPGSTWEHVRANEQRAVNVAGKVVEVAPPTRLVITWANPSQAADPHSTSRGGARSPAPQRRTPPKRPLARGYFALDQRTTSPLLCSGGTTHLNDRSCSGRSHVAARNASTAKSCIITVAKS